MASGPGDAGAKRKGNEYFGPYAHTYAIRKTLDQLLRTFPVRTCTDSLFGRQRAQGRPCLLYHIEKCSGPCIDAVAPEDYQQMVDGLAAPFLRGDTEQVLTDLQVGCGRRRSVRNSSSPPGIGIGSMTCVGLSSSGGCLGAPRGLRPDRLSWGRSRVCVPDSPRQARSSRRQVGDGGGSGRSADGRRAHGTSHKTAVR